MVTFAMPPLPPPLLATIMQAPPSAETPAPSLAPKMPAPAPDGNDQPLPNLPPLHHVVVAVVIFLLSAFTISISQHSNLVPTLWPTNGIMLAVLLCHARNLT